MRSRSLFTGFDPWLFGAMMFMSTLGLFTMYSFQGDNTFFNRQIVWVAIATGVFFAALIPDYRFLRMGNASFYAFVVIVGILLLVPILGDTNLGATRRIDLGLFSLQPSDPAKLVLIMLLAKYFAKRHALIGDVKHIIVSGCYALVLFGLVFMQPDFGSAMILFFIWLGMVLVAGIKVRHLVLVTMAGLLAFGGMWQFGFQDYQKQRILTFLDPLSDIQGAGYNAYQSTVAVGSGQIFGKGVGYGTQSKLLYLPEYETDFIFAAYAEEWGLAGVVLLFVMFAVIIWRLMHHAVRAAGNFETLFTAGVAIFLLTHFFVHIGMNIGLLPVTGTTVPFMSYGGSHLVTEFLALGMVLGMQRHARPQKVIAEAEELFVANG